MNARVLSSGLPCHPMQCQSTFHLSNPCCAAAMPCVSSLHDSPASTAVTRTFGVQGGWAPQNLHAELCPALFCNRTTCRATQEEMFMAEPVLTLSCTWEELLEGLRTGWLRCSLASSSSSLLLT